jgi:hypothetical protein
MNENNSFWSMPNLVADDITLSLKAKGLYLLIQCCIEDPEFDFNHYKPALMAKCKEGSDAFDSTWKELKKAGYLKQHRISHGNSENKGFHYEYELLGTVAVIPAPVKCGECRFRICNNKCGLDEQPRRDFDDDDFCSQGEREIPSKQLVTRGRTE